MTGWLGRIVLLVTFLTFISAGASQAECSPLAPLVGCEEPAPPSPAPPPQPEPPAPPAPPAPPPAPVPVPEPQPEPDPVEAPLAARRLVELMNAERTQRGLPPLQPRDDVAAIARPHSLAMAEADDIWHNDAYFSAATKRRLGATSVGENVAMNVNIDDAHRRLMNSAAHRANILNGAFTVVGVGVYRQADGTYFLTEDFVEPVPVATSAAAPAQSAAAADAVETPRGTRETTPVPPAEHAGGTLELASPADLSAIDFDWDTGRSADGNSEKTARDVLPLSLVSLLLLAGLGTLAARRLRQTSTSKGV